MKPFTIKEINPNEPSFYDFKNFIGILKPKEKIERNNKKIKTNKNPIN